MVVLNNEILKQIDELGKAAQTSMIGDLVINYIGSKNSCENLTLALRSVKEDLKEILSQYPEVFTAGQLHYSLLEEVIEELGWKIDNDSYDFNGWDHDTWFDVLIKDRGIGYHVFCSWADPRVTFEKFKINEKESNNC